MQNMVYWEHFAWTDQAILTKQTDELSFSIFESSNWLNCPLAVLTFCIFNPRFDKVPNRKILVVFIEHLGVTDPELLFIYHKDLINEVLLLLPLYR